MNLKQVFILFAMATLSLIAIVRGHGSAEELQRFLARTSGNDCYNKFAKHTQNVVKKCQVKNNFCEETCNEEKSKIEEETVEERNTLVFSAKNACAALHECEQKRTTTEVLACLAKAGMAATKTMTTINSQASQYLSDVEEKHLLADNKKYKCTNETKVSLDTDMSLAGIQLNDCMKIDNFIWNIEEEISEDQSISTPENEESFEDAQSVITTEEP